MAVFTLETDYPCPGCQRLFMRGFRFRSSLKKWPEEKASPLVYTKTCHPAKAPRRTREKPLVPRIGYPLDNSRQTDDAS